MTDPRTLRRRFAALIARLGASGDKRIEAAFAAVERERYCGPGPWWVADGDGYALTQSADPEFLYRNAVIGLAPARRLNNGEPSSHALWLKAAAPQPGELVAHIGAGAGYYTAILAELVGPAGRVEAYETDIELAARARQNLADRANVVVHARSGAKGLLPEADVIYVNAGATAPQAIWLDALRRRGRLIFPLTPDAGIGGMLLVTRGAEAAFSARFVSGAAFYPCADARDVGEAARLAAAFAAGGANDVRSLHRDVWSDPSCWLAGRDWRLSR
jgi:protein-L-isoaspartate(D-aspartate) O-methyltransferase